MENQTATLGVSKFNNINGVTCYMNSILAILQQTPILCDYIVNGYFKDILLTNLDNNLSKINETIIYNLYRVLKISLENDNKNITPKGFRNAISKKDYVWGEQQQQDSQEFLNFILMNIESEIEQNVIFLPGSKNILNKKNNNLNDTTEQIIAMSSWEKSINKEFSPLKLLFSGQFKKTNECSICNNLSYNFENFESLSLSIPIKNKGCDLIKEFSLFDCLDYYFKEEQLDSKNKLNCNFCFLKNQSKIHNKLFRTPKILIIQIKRFLVNNYNIPTQKLINKINFPIKNLNISKYIDKNSPDYDKCNYNLFAVNYHQSMGGSFSCSFGHYVSNVKNRLDNEWYEFDDNIVNKITSEKNLINNNAYLLFYYRDC